MDSPNTGKRAPGSELQGSGSLSRVVDWLTAALLVVGGLVSGYLREGDTREGATVGAYAGLVAAVPLLVLGLFVFGGLAIVATELALGVGVVLLGLALMVLVLFASGLYLVGLSALGGYLGARVAERESGEEAPEHRGPGPAE